MFLMLEQRPPPTCSRRQDVRCPLPAPSLLPPWYPTVTSTQPPLLPCIQYVANIPQPTK